MAARKEATARKSKSTGVKGAKPATKNKTPLLPPAYTTFIKNTGWRTLGALSLAMAGGFLLALISYNPFDPGVNNLTDAPVQNWLGTIGANVSDVLMQTLALVAYLLVLPFTIWGFKVVRLKWLPLFWLNLSMLPIALVLLAIAASVEAPTADFVIQAGYGGALGQQLWAGINTLMESVAVVVPWWTAGLIFLILGLPIYAFSLGLTKQEWQAIGALIKAAIVTTVA
ncbi:MAG: DNA translocase FtsK 4TM domain-containing protein, partial [Kordiimonadaceae bacterium]|nr:DNA translocase FtsK 4TM domain-containing protein [Kordiimonadaceae bacterium]